MVLILNSEDVKTALSMRAAIKAVERGFSLFTQGRGIMPQRVQLSIKKHDSLMLYMPAYLEVMDSLVVKEVAVYRNNPLKYGIPTVQGTVLLNDPENGKLLALIEGGALTALRTGAAAGVATKYLANKDSEVVGIFGAGIQARSQLEAILEVRDIRKAKVFDVSKELAEQYITVSKELGIDISYASPEDVAKADIIATATTSKTPVFRGDWLKPGTHVNAIGSHTPDAREIDTGTIIMARGRIVVDSREACLQEAGDLMIPIREGVITKDDIYAEIGEITTGVKAGRITREEISLFKSVGLAIQDAAAAHAAYVVALKKGIGREVDF